MANLRFIIPQRKNIKVYLINFNLQTLMGGIIVDSTTLNTPRLLRMKNSFFTFLVFLISLGAIAQNCEDLTIKSTSHEIIKDLDLELNFINLCVGDPVNFMAESQNNSVDYKWYINDEEKQISPNFSHTFNQSGGYTIKLTDSKEECFAKEVNIRVGFEPIIELTPNTIDACPDIEITLGSENSNDIQFSTKTELETVWQSPPCEDEFSEPKYLPDGLDQSYETSILIECFDEGKKITSVNDINEILINLEHSFMGDLDIYLTAPNGSIVTLFEAAGDNTWFGEATDDDDTQGNSGTGYDYGWSLNPSYSGTMAQGVHDNTTTLTLSQVESASILKPDTYLPVGGFEPFIGSTLNGTWKLTVVDTRVDDNGWIFKWGIKFKDELLPSSWTVENTIVSKNFISAPSIISNSDQSLIIKPTVGENKYIYEVKDDYGCPYTKELTVLAFDVKAHFEPSRDKVKHLDAIVDFNNLSIPKTNDIDYYWDFGNGDYSYDDNPQYNFYNIGTQKVQLTLTNKAGCTDTYSRDIVTEEDYLVWIPTGFSPNGDGINDSFKLIMKNTKKENYNLFIYDAWGKIVFESNDIDLGWDGTRKDNGIMAESGNYTYLCQFTTNQNDSQEKIGLFFLLE